MVAPTWKTICQNLRDGDPGAQVPAAPLPGHTQERKATASMFTAAALTLRGQEQPMSIHREVETGWASSTLVWHTAARR